MGNERKRRVKDKPKDDASPKQQDTGLRRGRSSKSLSSSASPSVDPVESNQCDIEMTISDPHTAIEVTPKFSNPEKQRVKDKLKDDSSHKQQNTGLRRGRSSKSLSSSASPSVDPIDSNQVDIEMTISDPHTAIEVTPKCSTPEKRRVKDNPKDDVSSKQQNTGLRRGRSSKSLSPSASPSVDPDDSNQRDIEKTTSDPHTAMEVTLKCSTPDKQTPNESLKTKSELSNKTHSTTQLDTLEDTNLLPDFIAQATEKKFVPIGPRFQADIPELDDSVDMDLRMGLYISDLNNSKWLGAKVWPSRSGKEKIESGEIGKGRPDTCSCHSPGSSDCIKFHVQHETEQLHEYLGHIFYIWKFNEMGEKQVLDSWSVKDQRRFDDIVRNRSCSDEDWTQRARKCFRDKSRKEVVSYYFNVYILRRMSQHMRSSSSKTAFNTDDEDEEDEGQGSRRRSRGKDAGSRERDSVKRRYLKGK